MWLTEFGSELCRRLSLNLPLEKRYKTNTDIENCFYKKLMQNAMVAYAAETQKSPLDFAEGTR